ncbi:MAG: hypothetical protein COV45_08220 [Deltaproteobacteria bacterium CG11_big_fil_rev_8_21_14_0_20_47_16]|nr:MAG: hypothetical protein COV45_08220 [Deltaproteobacteria bacterium CG11_big_fil_rev_8_21_14_0_20_47_16]
MTKPTLFCIHGGPGMDHTSLKPGILSLQSLFDLHFIDLNHDGGAYSLSRYASDVCEVVKKVAPSSPIGLFGHSFGGHVAMEALLQAPAFFDFAILANTFCNVADWIDYISYTSKLLHNPSAEAIEAAYNNSSKKDADFKQLMLGYAPLYFPEISLEEARRIMAQWHYYAAPYNDAVANIYSKIDMTQKCRHILAKCLVIGGAQDKIVAPQEVDRLVQLIPNATGVKIPNACHFPFITESKMFESAVQKWCKKVALC